ncbi:hypothetical protein FHR85_000551 [Alkalibacillus almallahensis]|nr:hypothetical protein [Alkalibacillus almallahensis]
MKYTIKHTVHPHRRDKRTGPLNPVKPSEYFKYLAGEFNRKDDQYESKND